MTEELKPHMSWRKEREFWRGKVFICVYRNGRSSKSDYLVKVFADGNSALTKRADWNTWQGHCGGALIIGDLVREANRRWNQRQEVEGER